MQQQLRAELFPYTSSGHVVCCPVLCSSPVASLSDCERKSVGFRSSKLRVSDFKGEFSLVPGVRLLGVWPGTCPLPAELQGSMST